jgi:prepilin-type N-terminal cleavage/methylation domain-containing protein
VKVQSESGFTLIELIMVMVVTGIISSTLILPFMAGLQRATSPEISATATYLAQKEIEEFRNAGYTITGGILGPVDSTVTFYAGTPREITYTEGSIREYVSYSSGTFTTSASATEFIRVTETVSNDENSDVVALWTILVRNFYDPNAN